MSFKASVSVSNSMSKSIKESSCVNGMFVAAPSMFHRHSLMSVGSQHLIMFPL